MFAFRTVPILFIRDGLSLTPLSLSAPSLQARLWAAPSREKRCAVEEDLTSSPTALGVQETIAESMYIGRPLVHCILPTLGLCQTLEN